MTTPLVLKVGGELVETPADRARLASCAAKLSATRPLVIVHGGGRAIDVELQRRGLTPTKVDGLRVTDADTLGVVISVLAGETNTALVAALVATGVRAVGLTGIDAGMARTDRASAHRGANGVLVDLGLVGDPARVDVSLVELLLARGYVPVVASLGLEATASPSVLNVNADVMAARLAGALTRADLVIAGTTPGVFDDAGSTIDAMDEDDIEAVIASGTATAGMVAKLAACRDALAQGVASIRIIDGRPLDGSVNALAAARGTTIARRRQASSSHTASERTVHSSLLPSAF